jgi:zinc transport system ATP-binding protein
MNKNIISVKKLTKKAYGQNILLDVSFDIEKKSLISLIGPNGAGKSTLVKILLGFDTEYEGEIKIAGSERFGYIPQINASDHNPVPLSVKEYISVGAAGLYNKSKKKGRFDLHEILEHVGVSIDKLNQSFWSLSGGERQRVAIARVLLSEPTILVLDEPLSAVDYASLGSLYSLIHHLQKKHDITVILVSHDIGSVLSISDRVLCLNQTLHANCHPRDYVDTSKNGKVSEVHHHC